MAHCENFNVDTMDLEDGYDPEHWLPIDSVPTAAAAATAAINDNQELTNDNLIEPSSPVPSTSSGNIMSTVQPPTWQSLLQAHQTLLHNKTHMDKRKFNKQVFELLCQTMFCINYHVQTSSKSAAAATNTTTNNNNNIARLPKSYRLGSSKRGIEQF